MGMLTWVTMGLALWHFTVFSRTGSRVASSERSSARCSDRSCSDS